LDEEKVSSGESEHNKRGSKVPGILLRIFAVLVIIAGVSVIALYLWQKDNIDALVDANKYSTEEIKSRIEDSREDTKQVLEEYNVTNIRDLTPEEELELCKGNMTPEEAVAIIMGTDEQASDATDTNDGSSNAAVENEENTGGSSVDTNAADKGTTAKAESKPDKKTEIVQKYVADMYTLKAKYMGQLGSLAKSAKAEYDSNKEEYGKAKAIEIAVSDNLSKAASLESQCDSEVNTLLSSFESELSSIGADTSIVDTMRTQYQNEKSLKKSYYLSLKN
jgi:hypothetical protein